MDEVAKLKLYTNTLSDDYVVPPWNDRYIDDIGNLSVYEHIIELAKEKGRYINIDDVTEPGYSDKNFKSTCEESPTKEQECNECCDYDEFKEECVYNPMKCILFFANNIRTWNEICGYHILYLKGETPGTPSNTGPWNRESKYIIDELTNILQYGILTLDSQPGLVVHDEEDYIQKPYLRFGGPTGRVHRILKRLISEKGIKYVDYGIRDIEFWGYKNYQPDGKDYVSVVVSVDEPDNITHEYINYILSNKFFEDIVEVVSTTN